MVRLGKPVVTTVNVQSGFEKVKADKLVTNDDMRVVWEGNIKRMMMKKRQQGSQYHSSQRK